MSSLNNTTLNSYLNGLSQSDWSTFSSDLNSNFATAWSSRFTLTTRQSLALSLVPSDMQTMLVNAASYAASALGNSLLLDVEGSAFDNNPSGSAITCGIKVQIYVDTNTDMATGKTTKSYRLKITISF